VRATLESAVWWRRTPDAETTLVCIGHAGAGAAPFYSWRDTLVDGVDLCAIRLPGRETRLASPPLDSMAAVVGEVLDAVAARATRRYAFFGHCSGAIIAFETARAVRRLGLAPPDRLLLTPHPAPVTLSAARAEAEGRLQEELRARLVRLGATDTAVLANPELFALVRPALEADLRLVDEYEYCREAPLEVPITLFVGAREREYLSVDADQWAVEAAPGLEVVEVPTSHVFAGAAWTELARFVGAALCGTRRAELTNSSEPVRGGP